MSARWAAVSLVCGLLAGCVTPPGPDGQSGSPAESLLLYYQQVRRLPPGELAREHDTARQSYARSRADVDRVRLAMVLSIPGTGFSDDSRALELLDPVTKNAGSQLQGLAYLLANQLQERRRLDGNAQGLQQKLDALRSLERSMLERKP